MFSVEGTVKGNNQKIEYRNEDGVGRLEGSPVIVMLVEVAMLSNELTGPVGQYMKRDINNPLAVLCVINECFDTIIGYDGDLPKADEIPDGALC